MKLSNLLICGAKSCGKPKDKYYSKYSWFPECFFKVLEGGNMKKIFTSESVTSGHPDKICDQISDAILDAYLKGDNESRVACETCISKNKVMIFGEVTSKTSVDIKTIVKEKIKEIGYISEDIGFDIEKSEIIIDLNKQSPNIALGVDKEDKGAGDQGMMFGYACNETENYMPMAIYLAHNLAKRLELVRKENIIDYLRPDGKTQVSVEYENNVPKRIDTIILSAQHKEGIDIERLRKDILENVINYELRDHLDENTIIMINPTGKFEIGGPKGDSGLTGRKIIVDTYGGYAKHGGGAFSGKDYTKVDKTAAYYARYVAKNLVAAKLCDRCEVGISYAIGISRPTSIAIETFNTGRLSEEKLLNIIKETFDFRPNNMIEELNLKNISYQKYSCYGHFGKEDCPWEKLDKVEILKNKQGNA